MQSLTRKIISTLELRQKELRGLKKVRVAEIRKVLQEHGQDRTIPLSGKLSTHEIREHDLLLYTISS